MLLTRREWIFGSVGFAAMRQVLLAQQHATHAVQAVVEGQPLAFE